MSDPKRLKPEPYIIWLHRVTVLAKVQDADLDRIIGGWRMRDRVHRWYLDDMTAEMAADSAGFMIRAFIKGERTEREKANYFRDGMVRVPDKL